MLAAYGVAGSGLLVQPTLSVLVLPVWLLAPGLIVLHLAAPQTLRLGLSGLFLVLAASPAVSAFLLQIATYWLGLSLEQACLLTLTLVGLGLVWIVFRAGRGVADGAGWGADWAPILVLLALTALPQLLSMLDPLHRLSVHGVFHGAYIGQILNGLIPPNNPALAEMPANHYWVFHLYLAALTRTSGLSYIDVSALTQVVALCSYVALTYACVAQFFSRWAAACVGLLAAFATNIQGPLAFIGGLLLGAEVAQPVTVTWVLEMIGHALDGILYGGIYVKFLTFTGHTHGSVFWALLIFGCLRREPWLVGIAMSGVLLIHPPTGLAALTAVPAAYVLSRLSAGGFRLWPLAAWRFGSRERPMLLAFALPVVIQLPYLLEVSNAVRGGVIALNPSWWSLSNLLLLYAPLLPLAAIGVAHRNWTDRDKAFIGLLLGMLVALVLLVGLPDRIQYKFMYLTSIPMGVAACWGLQRLAAWVRKFPAEVGMAVLAIFAYGNLAAVGFAWALAPWLDDRRVATDGLSITLLNQPYVSDVMRWLRDNTPRQAVILEDVDYCERSLVGAVAYRQSYYVPCHPFTTAGYDEAGRRARLLETLFTPGTEKPDTIRAVAKTLSGPAYIVLTREQSGEAFDPLLAEFSGLPQLDLVYQADGAAVFAIRE